MPIQIELFAQRDDKCRINNRCIDLIGKSAHFTHDPVGFTCVKNGFCAGRAEIARHCSDNSCLAPVGVRQVRTQILNSLNLTFLVTFDNLVNGRSLTIRPATVYLKDQSQHSALSTQHKKYRCSYVSKNNRSGRRHKLAIAAWRDIPLKYSTGVFLV